MRVLYFSTDYGPHDHRFLTSLAGTDHDVYFLPLQASDKRIEGRPVPRGVTQLNWRGAEDVFRWGQIPNRVAELRHLIREAQPDLIHAGPIQTCAFLAVLAGFSPILTMSWGFDLMQDADRNAWWRWVTRYTLRRSAYFVSDAQVTRSRALSYGMVPTRTAVFPWGVDLKHFRPQRSSLRRRPIVGGRALGRSDHQRPFVILCNRSWEPRYGVELLARAFVRLAGHHQTASLILLGGGSQASTIEGILRAERELGRVRFPGRVAQSDLPQWYRTADLFVSPSHVDGSSVSLMEALACGTPVLVSDIPANREWVRNNVNGWLFRDGDAEDLVRKALWISTQPAARQRVGREARKVAEERANWSSNFEVLMRAYEKALEVRH